MRGDRRVIRRVDLNEQIVRADHFVVEHVNGGNLPGDSRRNGHNMCGDESVVGGFVRERGDQIIQPEKQQHGEHAGCGPDEPR